MVTRQARWSALGLVCGLLGVVTPAHAHPLHTTLTQITYDSARKTTRVMIRVFHDDFVSAVSRAKKGTPPSGSAWTAAAQSYVASIFTLADRAGRAIPLHSCGMTQSGDLVWVCLETPTAAPIVGLRVRNAMLCDLYHDQVNIVQADDRGAKRSALFTRGDGVKPLS